MFNLKENILSFKRNGKNEPKPFAQVLEAQ